MPVVKKPASKKPPSKKPASNKDEEFERRSRASRLGHLRRIKRELMGEKEYLEAAAKWSKSHFQMFSSEVNYNIFKKDQDKLDRVKASIHLFENLIVSHERARDEHRRTTGR